jgi:hypothetical protein
MERVNIIGIETPRGYRTFELYQGDLSALDFPVDILVVSAFAGDYTPTRGSLIGALHRRNGIDVGALARDAEFDLREQFGVWVSRPVSGQAFTRVLGVELTGGGLATDEVIENIFIALAILEAKRVPVHSIALPLLGTGQQQLRPSEVIRPLLEAARRHLQRSSEVERVIFVAREPDRAAALSTAINQLLGREQVSLPRSQLLNALRQDLEARIAQARWRLNTPQDALADDWLRILHQKDPASFELRVLARKLTERIAHDLAAKPDDNLMKNIDQLGAKGVAQWMRSYMHVLRTLGNEAAHADADADQRPTRVDRNDLIIALFCARRLLAFWLDETGPGPRKSPTTARDTAP